MAICEFCNVEMDPKRLPRHRKVCLKNPALGYSEESVEVTSENLESLKSKPRTFHYYQKIHFICSKCNKLMYLSRLSFFEGFVCRNCKLAETSLQLYGCEKPQKAEIVKNKQKATLAKRSKEKIEKSNNKRKATCLGRYGVEAVSQDKSIRAKQIDTLKNKSLEEKTDIQKKREATMQQLYGENFQEIFLEKRKQTSLARFGADNIFKTEAFKEKRARACLETYGTIWPAQSRKFHKRSKEVCLERYGDPNFRNSEKAKQTCIAKYGIPHYPKGTYLYENEQFDSKWELALWIYAKDHEEDIEREPLYFEIPFEGKVYHYTPDFRYRGKIVELKGPQFFNKKGELQNPYDHSQDAKSRAIHQFALQQGVEFWSTKEVQPILDYVISKYTIDYLNLFRLKIPFPYPELETGDLNLIRYFHKSIYEASKKGFLSPLQAWEDKSLVQRSALNRLKYVHSCTSKDIIQGFSVARIAPKISIFKPSTAENLCRKYLKDYTEVFDPFSGFSGRLLGVTNCKKQYIGQDIHPKHVAESNEIIQYKKLQDLATVIVQDILTDEPKEFECLLTCPPYGGKEHWNENNDEIEKSCDEWIDICLEKYKCKRYLFVVDTTEKYKDNVIETFTNRSHFGKNHEYVILIDQCS